MDDLYDRNRFTEIDNQLAIISEQISYIVRLLKQNGFKYYEQEAAYKANLAMAKEINANWAKEVISEWEKEQNKVQDNSKSE